MADVLGLDETVHQLSRHDCPVCHAPVVQGRCWGPESPSCPRSGCGCGEPLADCPHMIFGYPFCAGCGEHHRAPVAAAGERCPVEPDLDTVIARIKALPQSGEGLTVAQIAEAVGTTDTALVVGALDELVSADDET